LSIRGHEFTRMVRDCDGAGIRLSQFKASGGVVRKLQVLPDGLSGRSGRLGAYSQEACGASQSACGNVLRLAGATVDLRTAVQARGRDAGPVGPTAAPPPVGACAEPHPSPTGGDGPVTR